MIHYDLMSSLTNIISLPDHMHHYQSATNWKQAAA